MPGDIDSPSTIQNRAKEDPERNRERKTLNIKPSD